MIAAGADPRVEHLGSAPYDYAKSWLTAVDNATPSPDISAVRPFPDISTSRDSPRSGRFRQRIRQVFGKHDSESQVAVKISGQGQHQISESKDSMYSSEILRLLMPEGKV